MARFTTNLTVTTPKETFSANLGGDYEEVFSLNQVLDNADLMHIILTNARDVGSLSLRDCKTLMIKNSGAIGAELNILMNGWTHASPDADTSAAHLSILLASGEFIMLPNIRMIGYSGQLSAARGFALDNQVPDSNMYVDSTANVDHATSASIGSDATETTLYVEWTSSAVNNANLFKVGDLIRIGNEIIGVSSIGSKSNLANTYLVVKRGLYGTTATTAGDGDAIRLPFFNAYGDFDKYSTAQTDASGRFKCFNFMGFGRYANEEASGIVAGSVSGKFYSAGYQELGMSGITASTASGLTASTAYQFTIAVDGGSAYDADVTTSTNVKWGGSDGVLRKIQDVFDTAYYTAGNLFEKKVIVSIVNGDIRFTSGQRLSTSAIALGDSSGGDTDLWAAGRIPAVANVEAAVAAVLPNDTIDNKKTGISSPNLGVLFYDDGKGNISGACSGTINYETGAIDLNGCPPNANFVVSANYGSAHSGGNKFDGGFANSIQQIRARSTNPKVHTTIDLIGIR